jgi:tetratricopeptide (TPR) repeat protein
MNLMHRLLLAGLFLLGAAQVWAQTEPECAPSPVADTSAPFSYYVGIGDAQTARKTFADALQSYTCAIQLQADYAPAYARRGYAYAALGDADNAMADYTRALELDEALVEAYVNRGVLYTQLGNFGLAIGDLTLAIQLDPSNLSAYNNRAVVHAIEGNYDLAIGDLRQAITVDPKAPDPYATLAAVYSALAAQNYQKFVEVGGPNARLPAGTPAEVIMAADDSLRDGNFTFWLTLVTLGEA